MYRNLKRLVSTEADEHHLKSMHGIKLYSMACVMLGHRLMFSLGSPIHNPEFIEGASTYTHISGKSYEFPRAHSHLRATMLQWLGHVI